MSSTGRLKSTLAKLAASPGEVTDGARRIAAEDVRDRIAGILDEIDETVLARDILVRNASGAFLSITARNRRLICLNPPACDDFAAQSDLFDLDAATFDDGQRGRLLGLLGTLCGTSSALSVTKAGAARGCATDIGLTAAQLKEVFFRRSTLPAAPDPLAGLLEGWRGECLGWLRRSGPETVAFGGDAGEAPLLEAIAETAERVLRRNRRAGDPKPPALQGWICGAQTRPAAITAVANHGPDMLVALLPGTAAARAASALRSAIG